MTLIPKTGNKRCRACRKNFEPHNSLQSACSPSCALVQVRRDAESKAKAQRERTRAQKECLKSRGDHTREAQQAFNAYVRARDSHLPCISCGRFSNDHGLITGSRIDAGHYRSVGACPELRFEELNCWAQCVRCNQHLSGNAVEYRAGLKMRIGDEKLAWLEGQHQPKHYTIDDLKAIKAKYRALTRELAKQSKAA